MADSSHTSTQRYLFNFSSLSLSNERFDSGDLFLNKSSGMHIYFLYLIVILKSVVFIYFLHFTQLFFIFFCFFNYSYRAFGCSWWSITSLRLEIKLFLSLLLFFFYPQRYTCVLYSQTDFLFLYILLLFNWSKYM